MTTVASVEVIKRLVVLIADNRPHPRALLRSMLLQLEVKKIHEVTDGAATLEALSTLNPDVMILEWDLPVLDGPEVMRVVRSPGVFPKPSLPIIMLTDRGLRSRVTEAIRLGVNEFLVKPISPKTLQLRLLGILLNPRPMVRAGKYYIPMPRRRIDLKEFISAA